MDGKRAAAILAISLMLLQAMVLMLPGVDTTGENQGTVSHDGVSVSYIDSSEPGYGIVTVSFSDRPGADYFTVSIDGGMTSAPIPVDPGIFAVPGGLSVGTHTLNIVCGDGGWPITIAIAEVIHATGVTIDRSSVQMTVGGTVVLKATVVPADAVEKDIVWSSSDISVATVSDGAVTAVSAGTAIITASVGDLEATCSISVSDSPHVHSWGSGTVTAQPTCTEPGVKTYKCSCGETKTEMIPAAGHSWDSGKVTEEATCTGTGVRTYTCSVCGETKTETIPAAGHSWSDWTVVKEPTKEMEGEKQRTCQRCGAEETDAIPRIETADDGDNTMLYVCIGIAVALIAVAAVLAARKRS